MEPVVEGNGGVVEHVLDCPQDTRATTFAKGSRSHLQPRLVGERYELRRQIGAGGMAEVYLATDLLLERDVVVKMLLPELRSDPKAVERFRREGVALATVHSPHVLPVHDIGAEAADMYLVLRYVRGRTLEALMAEQGLLPVERAATLVSQVLEGLGALHERRLVHRDVKPANVLVDWDDHVVLIDLGVVQNPRHPTLTPESATAGTPRFMAPEQRVYHVVDHRADIYQAGLLLLRLVTGVDAAALRWSPKKLEMLIEDLPDPIGAVIRRALADKPSERYMSAGEMRDALARALAAPAEPPIELLTPRERSTARQRPQRVLSPVQAPAIAVARKPPALVIDPALATWTPLLLATVAAMLVIVAFLLATR